ncbi:hypothetical protein [Microbacterium sp.]|uniref:hypothetical protein n=1 Tax=Microbacterium sp. TaxID=51671 RepID=UPI0039E52D01
MLKSIASLGAIKIAALALTFLATLGSIRIITSAYGFEAYGAVSLVATVVAFMPIADLGLSIGLTNLATRAKTTSSSSDLRLSLSTTIWILLGVGILVAGVGIIAGWLGVWRVILGPASTLLGNPDAYMPLFLALCGLWVATGPAYRLLIGQQHVNTVVVLQAVGPIASVTLTAIAAGVGAPIVVFAFFPLVCSLLASALGWVFALRGIPNGFRPPIAPQRIGRKRYARVVQHGSSGLMFMLGGMLLFSFDRVMLSQVGSPVMLSIYATCISLYSAAQSALGTIGSFLWSHYTRLRIQSELTPALVTRHTLGFAGLGVAVGGAVWAIFPVYLFLAGISDTDPLMAPLIGLTVALQAVLLPGTSALTLPHQLRSQGVGMLGALIAKICFAIWLIPLLGAPGVMLATILGIVLVQIPVVTVLVRRLPQGGGR